MPQAKLCLELSSGGSDFRESLIISDSYLSATLDALSGEAIWVIFGRGFFAACIAAVILLYAYYIIILETARQVGLTPTIEIRTTNLPRDVVLDEHPAWNVVLVRRSH